MANLTFVYRSDTPSTRRIFQERRAGFLQRGSVRVDDGVFTDENGHQTSYGLLRPYSFARAGVLPRGATIEPGEMGMYPLQFRMGRVRVTGPEKRNVLLTSSPTVQFTGGRVTLVTTSALGALTDFAIWGATQADPNAFYIESATDLNSGNVAQAATRHHVTFVPHRNARYLAVGARVYALPNTGARRAQYFKKWMLEKAHTGGAFPTPKYRKAREVIVRVKPDRLNYFTNPGAEVDTTGFISAIGAPTFAAATDQIKYGTQSLRITSTSAGTEMSFRWVNDIAVPAGTYTISHWIYSNATPRDAWISVEMGDGTVSHPPETVRVSAQKWTQVSRTFTIPVARTVGFRFHSRADTSRPIGTNIWYDGFLFEEGDRVREYFDGSTSADTMWEVSGDVGKTRSYFYKNRADRYAAIKRVLEDNVPLGIGVAEPVMGALQVEWTLDAEPPIVVEDYSYGASPYGDGPYGG